MPLTAEQRSAQNRLNARKSTGPRSAEGKQTSRLNAVKHGPRADPAPLPGEDVEAVARRAQTWNDYYDPQSPAAQHLVNECVRATLLSDRVARCHEATAARRAAAILEAREARQGEEVAALAERLAHDPAALDGLAATAAGCRWLAGRWDDLARRAGAVGGWSSREVKVVG